jgi:7,8-dihydropterin-6-yl-methyl-4-(beta-D-ribofuranosyl)aminobenzene 5'-phosphate synthase
MTPAGTLVLLNPEPTFEAIESAGGRVTKHAKAHVLAGFFFVSGEIERVTSYEAGFDGHHTVRDGHTVPDPLILDERFLAARVRGRGVSVLSPCSHAGVVNTALGALGAFGASLSTSSSAAIIWQAWAWSRGSSRPSTTSPVVSGLASSRQGLYRLACQGGARACVCAGNYGPSVVGSLYALRAT